MEVPYFAVEEDDFDRSQDYIESLKGTLKQAKGVLLDDDEEINDQWLDEIIQSVFTDGQRATFKINLETISKKNKMARGDVRSLFDPIAIPAKNIQGQWHPQLNVYSPKPSEALYLNVADKVASNGVLRREKKDAQRILQNLRGGSDSRDGDGMPGPCLVHHLGPNDLILLRGLAETEILTVLRQNGNLKVSRLQSKRKPKDGGVFGVPLQTLLERDIKKHPNIRVPMFVTKLISILENHVHEEGILRVSGSLSRIKETVQALETDDNYLPLLNCLLPHDLAGLLKQFLRDLPSPIFTLNWLDAFCKALAINDETVKLHAFKTLLCLLPDVNKVTLQLVLGLLHRICQNAGSNKMTLENVAVTIGPSLFLVESPSRNSSNFGELESLGKFVGVTSYLLRNIDKIWAVPPLFLRQIRQIHTERDTKKKKLAERKGNDQKKRSADRRTKSNGHAENTFEHVFVHSSHPDFPSLCLKLSNTMTVADVLNRFNRFKEPYFLRTSSLFECGGSIEHQVLSPASNISEVLDENPHAKFYFCRQSPDSLILRWPQLL